MRLSQFTIKKIFRTIFVEDVHWQQLNHLYQKFIQDHKDKKIALIELGVGFNTPGIIRFPFERMTLEFPNVTLIRVNNQYADTAFEIENKSILLKEDCQSFIEHLIE